MPTTYLGIEVPDVGVRIGRQRIQIAGGDDVEVAVAAPEVQAVADDELVADLEADEGEGLGRRCPGSRSPPGR